MTDTGWTCNCDYEAPEFHCEDLRKARKQHRCTECFCTIHSGELYEHVIGKWEGAIDTFNTCAHCLQARRFYRNNNCGCFSYGSLWEDLEEMAFELYPGTGLKFHAYRLFAKYQQRRNSRFKEQRLL